MRSPETPWHVKAAGALAGTAIALVGCGDQGQEASTPQATSTENPHTLTVEPTKEKTPFVVDTPTRTAIVNTETPIPTATATPVTPEATPTERVQDTPCIILPEEFCKNAEPLRYVDSTGTDALMLGFKNLPAGTPVMAPTAATVFPVRESVGSPWKGNWALVDLSPDGSKPSLIIGDIGFENPDDSLNPGAGEIITTIQGSGVENAGYSLLVLLGSQESIGGKLQTNQELYESLFPGITTIEPVATIERTADSIVLSSDLYID